MGVRMIVHFLLILFGIILAYCQHLASAEYVQKKERFPTTTTTTTTSVMTIRRLRRIQTSSEPSMEPTTTESISQSPIIDSSGSTFVLASSLPLIEEIGNNGLPENVFPLPRCKGDCDSDDECEEGLICFFRDGNEAIPGCTGQENARLGIDFCISNGSPTSEPSVGEQPSKPSIQQSSDPSAGPSTSEPTHLPSQSPSKVPSIEPTQGPSPRPTPYPTPAPVPLPLVEEIGNNGLPQEVFRKKYKTTEQIILT